MNLVWTLSIFLGVLALNVQQAWSYKSGGGTSCTTPDGQSLQNLKTTTSKDCRHSYICVSGNIISGSNWCPPNTICSHGLCKCGEGYTVRQQSRSGKLKSCQKSSNAWKDRCLYGGELYLNGQKWLDVRCARKLSCENGAIVSEYYSQRPANTHCVYERLKCNKNFVSIGNYPDGLLKGCRRLKDCTVDGTLVKSGTSWLSNNCGTKSSCYDGKITKNNVYQCPFQSRCDNRGQCVCEDGLKEKARFSNGLLQSCQEKTEKDGICEDDGVLYEDGKVWLSQNCRHKHTCKGGIIETEDHKMVENSRCVFGQEECANHCLQRGRDKDGLLLRCRAEKDCFIDYKFYKNGQAWLSNNCEKKSVCYDGDLREYPHKCPFYSLCKDDHCECKTGWKSSGNYTDNTLWNCKKDTARDDKCEYNGDEFDDGARLLSHSCREKLVCDKGYMIAEKFYRDISTSCSNQQLKCRDGFVALGYDKFGAPIKCKAARDCKEGDTIYKSGSTWLSDDCGKRFTCYDGRKLEKVYACLSKSICVNGTCECIDGWKVKGISSNGLLRNCQEISAPDDVCKDEGKVYESGKVWLSSDCRQRLVCKQGIITYRCNKMPQNTFCSAGKMECEDNYHIAAYDRDRMLSKCKAFRDCAVGKKIYRSGSHFLSNNCRDKFICRNGDTRKKQSTKCPSNSHCDNEECKCNAGYVVKEQSVDRLLRACVKETRARRDGKCDHGGKVFNNGQGWYASYCYDKYYCKNGVTIYEQSGWPKDSQCINGEIKCKKDFKEERDENGLVKKCRAT